MSNILDFFETNYCVNTIICAPIASNNRHLTANFLKNPAFNLMLTFNINFNDLRNRSTNGKINPGYELKLMTSDDHR